MTSSNCTNLCKESQSIAVPLPCSHSRLLIVSRYGRLNVSGTVLSKRKIIELVKKGHVHAWDDPRLYTLIALRRRGIPPGAILSFVNELGVTKSTSNIEVKRFETSIRRYLEMTGPRLMLILEPLAVIIDDLPDDHFEMVEVPFSKDPKHGVCIHPVRAQRLPIACRQSLGRGKANL